MSVNAAQKLGLNWVFHCKIDIWGEICGYFKLFFKFSDIVEIICDLDFDK